MGDSRTQRHTGVKKRSSKKHGTGLLPQRFSLKPARCLWASGLLKLSPPPPRASSAPSKVEPRFKTTSGSWPRTKLGGGAV